MLVLLPLQQIGFVFSNRSAGKRLLSQAASYDKLGSFFQMADLGIISLSAKFVRTGRFTAAAYHKYSAMSSHNFFFLAQFSTSAH
jgi:hypothetical protein